MIYLPRRLTGEDETVLRMIEAQRERLRVYTQHSPRRWTGSLRRSTFARAIQGSNSIEGYHATIDDALAAVEDEPLNERTETALAIRGYRDAMTYVMQTAQDATFQFGKQLLKSLHFMMMSFDMSKLPGQWRPGSVYIISTKTDGVVYEGPDAGLVDGLVEELVASLGDPGGHNVVAAAMAHLNLTMIHPFKDGNGRMARALQTLVLSRQGVLPPVFSSIEEWLGRNTDEYCDVLAETGQGRWNPGRDASAWLRFCLKAHYQQAGTLIRRNEEYEKLYDGIDAITRRLGLPDRVNIPLFNAALGFRVTNSRYRGETDVTEFVASRDLKRLSECDLLAPQGEKRGRTYSAAPQLRELRASVRIRRPLDDPYALVAQREQGSRLPGL